MAITRNRLILAGVEDTEGVAETLTGSDAILFAELDPQPLEVDLKERNIVRSYIGNSARIPGKKRSRIRAKVEAAGSGTAGTPPRYAPLIRACGFAETIAASTSVTYEPVSTGFESVTINFYADGKRHIIAGCRGTFSLEYEEDEIPYFNFDLVGGYVAPTDTSNPAATYAAQVVPKLFNSDNTGSVSLHGYSPCISRFSVDVANTISYSERPGCVKQSRLTDRKPTGEFTIESPTIADKNFWTAAVDVTLDSISFQHGQTAGNIITLTMPKCSIDAPQYEDADGLEMLRCGFVPEPDTGNDEISLVFT